MAGDARRARVPGRDRRVAGDADPGAPAEASTNGGAPRSRLGRRSPQIAAPRRPLRQPPPNRPTPGPRRARRPPWRPSCSRTRATTSPTEKEEIGRQIGGNERELFVSCAPAEALQQQFEHLQPELHRRPRHRDLVVAQAPDRHRRGERPRGAKARDPPPGLRHGAGDARVRRAADRRQPAAAPLHHRGRRRHRVAPRDRARRCSPTAGSASSWSASCPATRSRRR